MKRKVYRLVNRLFSFLHLPIWHETKEEVEESFQKLVERLKRDRIYRDE